MKYSSFVLLGISAAANASALVQRAAGCNADNCARAVTGSGNTKPNPSSRLADCSSFMTILVTPVTSTVYSTVTTFVSTTTSTTSLSTVTVTDYTYTTLPTPSTTTPPLDRRVVTGGTVTPKTSTPTSVPAYASPCSGTARYSSACSCGGVTRGTSTLATATVTLISTITSTSSFTYAVSGTTTTTASTTPTIVVCPDPTPTFALQVTGTSTYTGQYVFGDFGEAVYQLTSTPSSATGFTITSAGILQTLEFGVLVNLYPIEYGNNPVLISSSVYGPTRTGLTCTSSDPTLEDGALTCVEPNGYTTLQYCGYNGNGLLTALYIGSTIGNTCQAIQLRQVPLCVVL